MVRGAAGLAIPVSGLMEISVEAGNLEAEDRLGTARRGLGGDAHGKESLDGMHAERGFVAVFFQAPGEDANLVEVEGEAGLWRSERGDVFRDFMVGRAGVVVMHLGDDVGANHALALGILRYVVGNIDVDAATQHPAGAASLSRTSHQSSIRTGSAGTGSTGSDSAASASGALGAFGLAGLTFLAVGCAAWCAGAAGAPAAVLATDARMSSWTFVLPGSR